ncbi:hypothetical protein [Salinactinospora qingdaonensis]|uniref:Uncharacterized protein n=1 Tax=Salinactinospora qingdaonensis TaxID=702744 RepID=A0ABP7GEZ6_9ACTN
MSLALILTGAVLVAIAAFNRVPRVGRRLTNAPSTQVSPSRGASRATATRSRTPPPPRLHMAPARLTEAGRATLTTLGGSMLIVAFFLTLSSL